MISIIIIAYNCELFIDQTIKSVLVQTYIDWEIIIVDDDVWFDENLGRGSDIYPIGEDFIFAMGLYKMKARMLFLPIPIVKHPGDSTGGSLEPKVIFGRGAMFARVFGWKAFFIDFIFSVKKYPTYFLLLVKGTNDYFTSHEKRVSCKN